MVPTPSTMNNPKRNAVGNNETQWARYQKRIRCVIEHIHENPGGTLTNDALAEVAHLSPYHWHRIYKSITGETAAATVKRCRMHHAAASILRTDLPLGEVGASVGYPDIHSFTRTFKAYYGIAPGKGSDANYADTNSIERPLKIIEKSDVNLIGLWHPGDYMAIGVTFEKVFAQCSMAGLMPANPQATGLYLNDPEIAAENELRSFAGLAVDTGVTGHAPLPAPLESYRYAGGRFAVLTHKGPYALLSQSYDWLYYNWLPASNETLRDQPCSEVYLNSPLDTTQQELLTEVCLPLQ